jgi:hypothetical protein
MKHNVNRENHSNFSFLQREKMTLFNILNLCISGICLTHTHTHTHTHFKLLARVIYNSYFRYTIKAYSYFIMGLSFFYCLVISVTKGEF